MNDKPQFDFSSLTTAMGVVPPRIDNDSVRRVRLLHGFSSKTLEGKEPTAEELHFAAGAIARWLQEGGDLVRDHLRLAPTRGSHRTANRIWLELHHRDDAHDLDEDHDRDERQTALSGCTVNAIDKSREQRTLDDEIAEQ